MNVHSSQNNLDKFFRSTPHFQQTVDVVLVLFDNFASNLKEFDALLVSNKEEKFLYEVKFDKSIFPLYNKERGIILYKLKCIINQ